MEFYFWLAIWFGKEIPLLIVVKVFLFQKLCKGIDFCGFITGFIAHGFTLDGQGIFSVPMSDNPEQTIKRRKT